jgi:hypothetical protein
MTATLTRLTRQTIVSSGHDSLSTTVGLVVVALLLILLLEATIMDARSGESVEARGSGLYVAILPLALASGVVMAMRLLVDVAGIRW